MTEPRTDLVCDVCGKPPWWSLSRVGDPCPDDAGHLVPAPELCPYCGEPKPGHTYASVGFCVKEHAEVARPGSVG